jgi:hypothetical protein
VGSPARRTRILQASHFRWGIAPFPVDDPSQ